MPLNATKQRDLQRLIDDKLDGDLSSADFQHLSEWLDESEDAREFYLDYVEVHAGIQWEFAEADADTFTPASAPKPFNWQPILFTAVAAAILVGIIWLRPSNPTDQQNHPRATNLAAQILADDNAEWSIKSDLPQTDNWLPNGRLQIASGEMTLRLSSGVDLVISGPSEIDLNSGNALDLNHGNLIAIVPKPAIGFTVHTPHGQIVDLGTIFAVQTTSHQTAVHVNKGAVSMASKDGSQKRDLKAGKAAVRKLGIATTEPIPYEASIFDSSPGDSGGSASGNFVHWGFDQRNQKEILDLGNLVSGPFPAILDSNRAKQKNAWPESPFGKGFAFNGINESLQSQLPGIAGSQPRTVALWVRVPKDLKPKNCYALVGWGEATFGTKGKKWMLVINRAEEDGKFGCFRTEFGGGFVIGTTDLRDGKWHHLASVWNPTNSSDLSAGLTLYVDGIPEQLSGKNSERVDTQIAGPKTHNIIMGKNLPTSEKDADQHFRGALDEIFIINRALTQEDVLRLMQTNRF